ncbi:16S rRNA (adenine(1518)-N(6)/adenine(1519)-N(6))-dimethyltransferase RsmA [Mycolicibacillus parakoreensis]|uniref:16S rRNA (adenine(1518)-N(6)/adenine(1519)-N(6))- dimethyltransferase RsmA n=1 Tax=Mycolicibacillus parakoreensis TaxID=1069221 RepID=UPI0027E378E3|nr:16S rRNA (adenine(1518)-N(6)/adenine(1519)-N(6))-dimethyltransferase RsmA [Mycolicibacillus parakoreensis]MCV7315174.1 16S rRNA (adenine(1518)-N(6)/adenine(1519)-N(6))-dimethyltransferase RsmA [Mycolicibacillus parakoreensis]HLR98721.1 16S rRNA (adenine(1518)-N(6)/adenine(1519)-N(6))-dimethyltransferase RsmA [Mycolicibacillus parakoreensis]
MTIRFLGRAEIRSLATELGLHPRKSLGQNFVHDANTVRRVAAVAAVGADDHVLEVGPGLGSLTLALLQTGARVSAVEVDPVLAARLPRTIVEHAPTVAGRVAVLEHDIVTVTAGQLAGAPTAVVANLPYNIAVPALLHLLAEFPTLRTLTVMVQSEVAERLAAEPGGKHYGVPSVKVRFFGRVRRAGTVAPAVFWPVPRVDSGLVRIDRYARAPWPQDAASRSAVFTLIDTAFGQRRKTLRNTLADWAGSAPQAQRRLAAAGIDPGRRGETLRIEDFVRLAAAAG